MNPRYDLEWLKESFDNGKPIDYLFFWGHSNRPGEPVGKSCFSQWYVAPFLYDGIVYRTAEHWMMAQKAILFNDTDSFRRIIEAKTPKQAKEAGRSVSGFDEEKWHAQRFDIVKEGNIHKFSQNQDLAAYLLSTHKKVLVEASPVDAIWGIGLNQESNNIHNPHFWRGLNLLGFALMEVRDFIGRSGTY